MPKVQCSDAESLRQKDRVKKIQKKNSRGTKSGAQKRKKIPEGAVFAVFSIRAMFCRKSPAGDGIFFKGRCGCAIHIVQTIRRMEREKRKMDALNQAIAQISDVLWNSVLLFLLVGTGSLFLCSDPLCTGKKV